MISHFKMCIVYCKSSVSEEWWDCQERLWLSAFRPALLTQDKANEQNFDL